MKEQPRFIFEDPIGLTAAAILKWFLYMWVSFSSFPSLDPNENLATGAESASRAPWKSRFSFLDEQSFHLGMPHWQRRDKFHTCLFKHGVQFVAPQDPTLIQALFWPGHSAWSRRERRKQSLCALSFSLPPAFLAGRASLPGSSSHFCPNIRGRM